MIDLDDRDALARIDRSGMRGLLNDFPNQVAEAWAWQAEVPSPGAIDQIAVCGMGGSSIVGWEDADRASRFAYLLLRDAGEYPQVARRFDISRALLQDRGYMVREAESADESSVLARLMGLIVLGDWVSYYRAVLDETDPTPVALIESLKQRLENHGDD